MGRSVEVDVGLEEEADGSALASADAEESIPSPSESAAKDELLATQGDYSCAWDDNKTLLQGRMIVTAEGVTFKGNSLGKAANICIKYKVGVCMLHDAQLLQLAT